GLARRDGHRLTLVAGCAEVEEEDAAQAADNADRRQGRFDHREAQLGIGEESFVAEEREVVVAPQFGVATEVEVPGELTPALVAARAESQDAVGAEPPVVA